MFGLLIKLSASTPATGRIFRPGRTRPANTCPAARMWSAPPEGWIRAVLL